MNRIVVTIDRLMLKGIDPGNHKAFAEGLQAELSRVLADAAENANRGHSYHTPVVRLGRMPIEPGPAGARKFGGGVARAIAERLKP